MWIGIIHSNGNRIKTTLPDGKCLNQLYYGSGHLYNQSLTDEQGNIFEIRHSTTNKLHQEVTRQQGELLSSFGYDPMGRLVKQYSSNDKHIVIERSYAYDKVGQLTHIASSTRLTQAVAHRPNQVIVNHYQRNHQYQYDKLGRLTEHKLTDFNQHQGVQERFAFDPASNRVPLPHVQNNEQTSNTNAVNGQGIDGRTKRPTRLISQGKKVGYVYDKHGRVIQKTMVPVDKDGNELAQSVNGLVGFRESLQLAYNANGELSQSIVIKDEGLNVTTTTTNYFYDAFGRRVAKSSEVQKASKINQRGKLVRFPDSLLHLRVDEKANRQTMLMLWDGNRQIQEITDNFTFTTVYEQNSFVPVARIVERQPHVLEKAKIHEQAEWGKYGNTVLTERTKANIHHKVHTGLRIYHYHTDHLGTPQELTNDRGDVVWLNYSQAWGGSYETKCFAKELDNLDVSADLLQPIRFQGQFFDSETNLHYNRFRYYDSDVGMFVSRDPIGLLGGNNIFQYAPNPIAWIDVLGLNRVLIRYVSEAEARAIHANGNFVQIIGNNGKLSRKAIWVNDVKLIEKKHWNPSKECYRVKITLDDKGAELIDSNNKDISLVNNKETGHTSGVLTKKNEIGAKGIGLELLPKLSEHITRISVERYDKEKKIWKPCPWAK